MNGFVDLIKKSIFVLVLCIFSVPVPLVAQEIFDPFASEYPPEVEAVRRPPARTAPQKRPQKERQSKTQKQGTNQAQKGQDRSSVQQRQRKQKKRVRKRNPLPVKIEQPEPSYIGEPLEFKIEVGLEHNVLVSGFQPSVDFADLTQDGVRSDFFSLEELIYPSLKLRGGRGIVIQSRPTLSAVLSRQRKSNGRQATTTELRAEASETFVSITPSGRFSLQVGKQNFQWGLAELGSPSNWIYRAELLGEYFTKSPQSKVDVRDLVRVNVSVGQSLSFIAMAEYESRKTERPQIYSGRRAALKGEFSWRDGANSFGLLVGGAERLKTPFLGEYFSLSFGEAFTLYGDVSQMAGSPVVKPVEVTLGAPQEGQRFIGFDQPYLESDVIETDAVLGFKYTFLSGWELRLEGAYSSVGLTQQELELVRELEKESSPLLPVFFDPGVEFRSEAAVFLGLKRVGFGKGNRWTVFGRYFVPVSDFSGGLFGYGEYLFSDNSVLFFSAGGYHGNTIAQAAYPRRWSVSLGQKYVW